MLRKIHVSASAISLATAALLAGASRPAEAQSGYYATIAYSQTTGKIGYSARQSQTKEGADRIALQMCGAPDAKVWMWAQNEWVAIAVVDGHPGIAGFGRGATSDEAQRKAMAECAQRAKGHAHRVAWCIHSSGARPKTVMTVAAEEPVSRTGYFAAIAYSPSTGKVGHTVGEAKTLAAAKDLATKKCGAADAKAFMWGSEWVAIAVAEKADGAAPGGPAGFGPGMTREAAEKAALEQFKKYGKGAPGRVVLCVHSSGEKNPKPAPTNAAAPAAGQAAKPGSPSQPAKPPQAGGGAPAKSQPQPQR